MKTTIKRSENLAALRWACRRGMLELDLLLGQFLEKGYELLGLDQRELFIELLDEVDTDLYAWLMGNAVPPRSEWLPLLQKIREYHPCLSY